MTVPGTEVPAQSERRNTLVAGQVSIESGSSDEGSAGVCFAQELAQGFLAALVESSDDAVISENGEGVILTWNRGAEQIFGFSAKEMIGSSVSRLLPPDRRQEEEGLLARLSGSHPRERFETVRLTKTGGLVPVALTLSLIRNAAGATIGISRVARDLRVQKRLQEALAQHRQDIAERRKMEQALRESEQRLRATFDKAAVGIVEVDEGDRVIAVNDRLCQILGYCREELLGKTVHELTAPEDQAISDDLNAKLHNRRLDTFSYEKRYLKRDGSPLWVHVAVSPVRDEDGRSHRHIGTVEEISDRKRAEQALRESEARYRTITEAMPHLVWQTRADGALEYLNGKWTEYTGLSLAESQQSGWLSAVHPDDSPHVAAVWRTAMQSPGEFNCNYRLRARDGSYRWFKSWGIALRDEDGRVLNWFGACTDIDDVVKAREVLCRSRDELERTVHERTQKLEEMVTELETFSYGIAHDMRAPLRTMQGFAVAVLEDYGDLIGTEGKSYLRRIEAAAARQDHYIRDVLNYSRLVRQDFVLEKISLDAVLKDVIAEYPNLQEARPFITVAAPLGAVLGHGPCLVQCLSNLLGNAIKFVRANVPPQVRVWTERHAEMVRLWVEDNGIGIAPEQQDRVFRMFERLHGQEEYPGTGIGLAVVRKAVERMGGHVGVESELGGGSRFWLELKASF